MTHIAKSLTLTLCLVGGLLHAQDRFGNQDRIVTVDVRAQDAWRRTGIQVQPGTTILLQATGAIEAVPPNDTRPEFHRVPPEGRPMRQGNKPQPLMRMLALLVRIGDGPVMEAGSEFQVVAGDPYGAGELQLGINDDFVMDNAGSWSVRITLRNPVSQNPGGGRDRGRDQGGRIRRDDPGAQAIDAKTRELGAGLGAPLTDVQAAGDGSGRVRTFQNGSIYWSAATGAHEVHGGIREQWNGAGAERGRLGFPISDETVSRDGRSRVSRFQNGSVIYDISSGTTRIQEGR